MSTLEHHKRQKYCTTRLKYRQGRQLKAVKVYTVTNESQHLLVFGVPKVNLQHEIKQKLQHFGQLESIICVTDDLAKKVELEQFTDVYHAQYRRISDARKAKRYLDAQQFYGGILHISYAPEYETIDELRDKLCKRKEEVDYRIFINAKKEKLFKQNNGTTLTNETQK